MMPGVGWSLLHACGVLAEFNLKSAGLGLAVGVTVMAVSLLVMSRTQWGQAQPISKCIALALFAHLLLFVYAYDTELELGQGGGGGGGAGVVTVALVDDAGVTGDDASDGASESAGETSPEIVEGDVPAETPTAAAPTTGADGIPAIEPPPLTPAIIAATVAAAGIEAAAAAGSVAETPSEAPPADSLTESGPIETEIGPPPPISAPPAVGGDVLPAAVAVGLVAVEALKPRRVPPETTELPPVVPEAYQNRVADDHLPIAERTGGNVDTEQAVGLALTWFSRNQSRDGRWDADQFGAGRETKILGNDRRGAGAQADTGLTGLALLAFLAGGHTHQHGGYQANVDQGLKFLISQQAADGNLAGTAELFARMYCHGMATLAMSEAYAMTDDPALKLPLQRAIRFTLRSQHPQTGGWRYLPGDQGDMSQFGWQVMALKSAELGGLPIPDTTMAGMKKFLETASSGDYRGLVSYRPGERPSRVMTAEGLACRWLLGTAQDTRTVAEATSFILQEVPRHDRENLYYWYYGTLAMFHLQDERWRVWNSALQAELLTSQRRDGDLAGSWDPDAVWGNYGGRIYSTALSTLCLEVYYRYLPLTQRTPNPIR